MTLRGHPLSLSFGMHMALAGLIVLLSLKWELPSIQKKVDFEVIEYPKPAAPTLQVAPPQAPPKQAEPKKAVFGVSRNALTTESTSATTAEVKQGNTVAKEQDNLKLEKDDPDSLPIPTDDYLVSQMPRLKSEVRILYPEEAKRASIEGPVVMDLLIGADGRVRKVDLIKGPGYGLNEAAVQALMRFEFTPAKMGEQTVAVKIRYTYRFILEGR